MSRDRWVRRHTPDYAQAFNFLLPTGMAWPRYSGSVLQEVVSGMAEIWGGEVERSAETLLTVESDPRTTMLLLPDWERAWGLPDKCIAEPMTVEARRTALVHKMTLLGGQSREFFIALAAYIGYTITIREFSPFMCGVSRCGDTSNLNDIISEPATCQLLLHFNGANESRTFLDSSGSNQVLTPYGDVKLDTSKFVFSASSAKFDGTGDYLSLGDTPRATASACTIAVASLKGGVLTVGGTVTGTWSVGQVVEGIGVREGTKITAQLTGTGGAGTYQVDLAQTVGSVAMAGGNKSNDFLFGTADFGIDFRFYQNGTNSVIWDSGSGFVSNSFSIWTESNHIVFKIDGVAQITGTATLSNGVWYHGALTRKDGSTKLFLNGAQEGSAFVTSTFLRSSMRGPFIGALAGSASYFNGWLDELRVLNDTAPWDAPFAVPTVAYASYVPPLHIHYRWEIGPPEMRFYWVVAVASKRYLWFRASSGQAGVDPHLRIGLASDLECALRRWKPAHTEIIFDYSPLIGLDYSKSFDASYLMLDIP